MSGETERERRERGSTRATLEKLERRERQEGGHEGRDRKRKPRTTSEQTRTRRSTRFSASSARTRSSCLSLPLNGQEDQEEEQSHARSKMVEAKRRGEGSRGEKRHARWQRDSREKRRQLKISAHAG